LDTKSTSFTPIRILEIEISQKLSDISAINKESELKYGQLFCLIRLHSHPLGVLKIKLDKNLTTEILASHIWNELQQTINSHLEVDGLPHIDKLTPEGLPNQAEALCQKKLSTFLEDVPPVTIVIATYNRIDTLKPCIESILALEYPEYQIIVVDNAPHLPATAKFMAEHYADIDQIHYIQEPRPGLAQAHNRGLVEIQTPIGIFTDDDVLVDKYWLAQLVKGFSAADNVACVTGMIFPLELNTQAQEWIEQYGGYSKGFETTVYDLDENRINSPLYPYAAGTFGSGASMALKIDALRKLGGFDPALGAGSFAKSGDDFAAFLGILLDGYQLVYEPKAILYHLHPHEYESLRKRVYGYGVGLSAYLTKFMLEKPSIIFDLASKVPSGLMYLLNPKSEKNVGKTTDYPSELTHLEWQGLLYGPIAYLRSRWRTRNWRAEMGL
jgi:GT2 family glycosyltransferase